MKRRTLFVALIAGLAAAPLASITAHAQSDAGPIVGSEKILKALNAIPKDVVLDSSGRPRPPRDPSIDLQVQFDFNSANLRPLGRRQLDELAVALNHKSLIESGFELAGHTDRVGTHEYNLQLSADRASAVRAYLASTHGIAAHRLQTVGYGFTRLADPGRPTAAINRRVEVRRILVARADRPDAATPAPAMRGTPPAVQPGGRLVPTPK